MFEILKNDKVSSFDILYKSLGVSRILKTTKIEDNYQQIYLYCTRNNIIPSEFLAKYLKYKSKYYKLKNKLN